MTDWLTDWLTKCTALHCRSLSALSSMMINDDVSDVSRLMTWYNWCQPVGQAHTDFLSYLLDLTGWSDLALQLHQEALNHWLKVRVWASGNWGTGGVTTRFCLSHSDLVRSSSLPAGWAIQDLQDFSNFYFSCQTWGCLSLLTTLHCYLWEIIFNPQSSINSKWLWPASDQGQRDFTFYWELKPDTAKHSTICNICTAMLSGSLVL